MEESTTWQKVPTQGKICYLRRFLGSLRSLGMTCRGAVLFYPHRLYLPRSGTAHRPFPTYFNGRIHMNNVGCSKNCQLSIVHCQLGITVNCPLSTVHSLVPPRSRPSPLAGGRKRAKHGIPGKQKLPAFSGRVFQGKGWEKDSLQGCDRETGLCAMCIK